jgi:hypothetical protein
MHTKFLPENLKERGHLEHLGVCEKIILEWFLEKKEGSCGLNASDLG